MQEDSGLIHQYHLLAKSQGNTGIFRNYETLVEDQLVVVPYNDKLVKMKLISSQLVMNGLAILKRPESVKSISFQGVVHTNAKPLDIRVDYFWDEKAEKWLIKEVREIHADELEDWWNK